MPKCDFNGLEDGPESVGTKRGRTRLLCKRGAWVARAGMLWFDDMRVAWHLRGKAGEENESMQGAKQVSRYVRPRFMLWSLTLGRVFWG